MQGFCNFINNVNFRLIVALVYEFLVSLKIYEAIFDYFCQGFGSGEDTIEYQVNNFAETTSYWLELYDMARRVELLVLGTWAKKWISLTLHGTTQNVCRHVSMTYIALVQSSLVKF